MSKPHTPQQSALLVRFSRVAALVSLLSCVGNSRQRPIPPPNSDEPAASPIRPADRDDGNVAATTLLTTSQFRALMGEVSGESAKRTVGALTLFHRMRGSRQFASAAARIASEARQAGFDEVETLKFAADGKTFYGAQRSRPAWDVDFAELWELTANERVRIASFASDPISLAQDSASGEASAELVDVGAGTKPEDYAGKKVAGKFVLTSSQPGAAYALAVGKQRAAGIVSFAQNQRSAWWKEDETLVRWGHLDTFPAPSTFAFMVSLKQARAWQEKMRSGETVKLSAKVEAGQRRGVYEIVTARIAGSDLAAEEIVLSCHLDHQRPGANDNASGCATILEVGRTLAKLIGEGVLPRPRRSIRLVWPPEIEGTHALLHGRAGYAERVRAAIHLDMVGGNAETKAIFHVTRSPKSLPTFVNDVSEAFARFVQYETERYAAGDTVSQPLVAPHGEKDPLRPKIAEFSLGSDHQLYSEGSFQIPTIYMNDWPDRYIHTSQDSLDRIDSTKLGRVAFIAAASAYVLADFGPDDVAATWALLRRHSIERAARTVARAHELGQLVPTEVDNLLRFYAAHERAIFRSIESFATIADPIRAAAAAHYAALDSLIGVAPTTDAESRGVVYQRTMNPRGDLSGFGYDYLADKGAKRTELQEFQGRWGNGGQYTYVALSLVDGKRSVGEIRNVLSAIYGPVPIDIVEEHLAMLASVGVVKSR